MRNKDIGAARKLAAAIVESAGQGSRHWAEAAGRHVLAVLILKQGLEKEGGQHE